MLNISWNNTSLVEPTKRICCECVDKPWREPLIYGLLLIVLIVWAYDVVINKKRLKK